MHCKPAGGVEILCRYELQVYLPSSFKSRETFHWNLRNFRLLPSSTTLDEVRIAKSEKRNSIKLQFSSFKKRSKKLSWNWFCDVVCLVFSFFLSAGGKRKRKCKKREKNGKTMNYKLSIHRIFGFSLQLEAMIESFLNFLIWLVLHWFIERETFE